MPEEQLLTINISPRTIEAPHFSTEALLAILGPPRHRTRARRRRADRAREGRGHQPPAGRVDRASARRASESRQTTLAPATPACACSASSASTSSRSTCRSSRRAPSATRRAPCCAHCATSPVAGAHRSSPRASRPPASCARSASSGCRQGRATSLPGRCLSPTSSSIDLEPLEQGGAILDRRLPQPRQAPEASGPRLAGTPPEALDDGSRFGRTDTEPPKRVARYLEGRFRLGDNDLADSFALEQSADPTCCARERSPEREDGRGGHGGQPGAVQSDRTR